MTEPLIKFNAVGRQFGTLDALTDVSFEIAPGTITALLGSNGAGKSTALRIAMNLLRPSAGRASVLGTDSHKLAPPQLQQIGYVADGMALPEWMRVEQFLAWCRPLYPSWDRDFEKRMLGQFDLPTKQRVRNLSRGQRMQAALVSSLAYRPKLVLLDEPFSGLDPIMRDELIDSVLAFADDGGWSAVISSHDVAEIDKLCDRMLALDRGELWLEEEIDSLLARHRRVELLMPSGTEAAPELPSAWIEADLCGQMLRFVATDFAEAGDLEDKVRRLIPEAGSAKLSSLTLREVFVCQLPHRRGKRKGTSTGGGIAA